MAVFCPPDGEIWLLATITGGEFEPESELLFDVSTETEKCSRFLFNPIASSQRVEFRNENTLIRTEKCEAILAKL